jgi:hypothetical protein
MDRSGWVKKYSFLYSLSPAKHWRSFGKLEITIDASIFGHPVTLMVGDSAKGQTDSIATWNFDKLPADAFSIDYTPAISSLVQTMIAIPAIWVAVAVGLLLVVLHFYLLRYLRRQKSKHMYLATLVIGGLVMPLLPLLSYMFWYDLIDRAIGAEAGGYHGYIFIAVFLLYPVLMAVYILSLVGVDRMAKKRGL